VAWATSIQEERKMHDLADLGNLAFEFFEIKDAYWRENEILKTMLRERGLSLRQIRGELRSRLKQQQVRETALETLVRCSQKIETILQEIDASNKLAKTLAKTQKCDMN
jgi:hypothetical protein